MRVIAGTRKGHKLSAPRGSRVRPSSDRVRTVLFDILGHSIHSAQLLDLFAGSGGIGIEALSRGAKSVTFVEKDRGVAGTIRENLKRTHLDTHGIVFVADAFVFLKHRPKTTSPPYDFVIADPPYAFDKYERLLHLIGCDSVLSQNGSLVLEVSIRSVIPSMQDTLEMVSQRRVGETSLLFYQKR